jgi:hypothetical protein
MIKKFKHFKINEVSGTELVGPVGPGYGETRIQNKTINSHDTSVIYSELDGKFYTPDEYSDIYNHYLKIGGEPLQGFNLENLERVIDFINTK